MTLTHLYDRICATAAHLKTARRPRTPRRPQGQGPRRAGRHPEDQALPAPRRRHTRRPGREARPRHPRPDQGLGRPLPGHPPTRPPHRPHRRGRRPRPTRLDAGPGDPPRPPLRVPALPTRRPGLRPRGDPAPLGVRKARALGELAGTPRTKLYLHLDADAPCGRGREARPRHRGQDQGLGRPLRVTLQPILRMDPGDRTDAVDAHDPPAWMRDQVSPPRPPLRVPALPTRRPGRGPRPHHPLRHTGPPGQTRPDNLAPLCRRHHRAKTTGRWQYRRQPDGTYAWEGPGIRNPGGAAGTG